MTNRKLWAVMLAAALVLAMAAVSCNKGSKTAESGTAWTDVMDSTFGNRDIKAIAFGNGMFVAGGEGGKIAYSKGK